MSAMYIFNGLGGVSGSILGGVITQYSHPRYAFLISSGFGLIILYQSLYLPHSIEKGSKFSNSTEDEEPGSFWEKLKENL